MAKSKQNDLGFDLHAAISTLHAEALKTDNVPEEDSRSADAWLMATEHSHGMGERSCRVRPCRLGGLCYALKELEWYRDTVNGTAQFIDAANETEVLRKALSKAAIRYRKTIKRLVDNSEKIHSLDTEQVPHWQSHDHGVLCVRPRRIIQRMTELQMLLEVFEDKLRGIPQSFQLQQSSHGKHSHLLLTAVRQHLNWGGLSNAEIATLVPDGLGTKDDSHLERVRHAIRETNARSIVPAELMGKLRKEKRIRAKNSKAERADSRLLKIPLWVHSLVRGLGVMSPGACLCGAGWQDDAVWIT